MLIASGSFRLTEYDLLRTGCGRHLGFDNHVGAGFEQVSALKRLGAEDAHKRCPSLGAVFRASSPAYLASDHSWSYRSFGCALHANCLFTFFKTRVEYLIMTGRLPDK